MDYVGYSANNPILHDVASCLTRDSSCSILKDVSIFVSKTFRRMGFPSMTGKLICVFLAIKYGPYFLATLVGRVPVLAAQHSTNVPLSWFEHNDQEKKQARECQCYQFFCPVPRSEVQSCALSSFHRSITPIGMAGMAPDSGTEAVFNGQGQGA